MGLRPTEGDENAFCPATTFLQNVPLSLSSRPGFPATPHWTRSRVRLSLKERRMRSVNATNFHRKSGGAKPTCPAAPRRAVGHAVEGSAVPRTSPGDAEFHAKQNCHLDRSVAQWRDLRLCLSSHGDSLALRRYFHLPPASGSVRHLYLRPGGHYLCEIQ
jgi:hypothetical protein